MELTCLTAISPVDGRYRSKCSGLAGYFSEYALFRYRVHVECEYLVSLASLPLPQLKKNGKKLVTECRKIAKGFDAKAAARIKEIESTTNHDVKAVEYYIREKLADAGLKPESEFTHFALTSQDINNTAQPLAFRDFIRKEFLPSLSGLITRLNGLADEWSDIPMLARTHGQAASPTLLGKEIRVFAERLEKQVILLKQIPFSAKFGGATGNFNAHHAAFPGIDWPRFADDFVNGSLGLSRSVTTTQIEHYDNLAAHCDAIKRINTILIDLNRDAWAYISLGYFRQKIKKGEVGSSAMPHKVNPIDFENSEGNLGIANALLEFFSAKLPVSRLQRDLTDSTVLRNLGVPMAHTLIAFQSLQKGLAKISVNQKAISADLDANWAVVTEAIQTILKAEGVPGAYEKLRDFSRTGEAIDAKSIQRFIDSLDISRELKSRLKKLRPDTYTGVH